MGRRSLLVVASGANVNALPESARKELGRLTFRDTITLRGNRPIEGMDPQLVLGNIQEFGWHIEEEEVRVAAEAC
jgi:hypothetical protein